MGTIERFEDIKSWQQGRELCKLVYQLTRKGEFRRDWGLQDQMRRAAVSIVSNIAEGFESQNDSTFVRYLYIAKASSGELRAQAHVAQDQGYISADESQALRGLAGDVSRLISGLIAYLQSHPRS